MMVSPKERVWSNKVPVCATVTLRHFSGLKKTLLSAGVYFSFHCLGFSQTGGTLNSPVRRSLCINAGSDLCSQTLIYWLSRTRISLHPWNFEKKPSRFHKRSLLQNILDSGVSAAWIIHDEECVINVWCAPTLSSVPLHNVDINDNTSYLNKACVQKCIKLFCYQHTHTNNYTNNSQCVFLFHLCLFSCELRAFITFHTVNKDCSAKLHLS